MTTLTVHLFHGEIVHVHLPMECSVEEFHTVLYRDVLPEAPLGCVVLRTLEGEAVTQLLDGLTVTAWVDPSRVRPVVERLTEKLRTGNLQNSWVKTCDVYRVSFLQEETHRIVVTFDLVYDSEDDQWARRSDFVRLKSHKRYFGHDRVRYPRSTYVGYETLMECVRHVNERIPTHEDILHLIQSQFDELPAEYDDDDDDGVEYDYTDTSYAREEYYEEHIRWGRHGDDERF